MPTTPTVTSIVVFASSHTPAIDTVLFYTDEEAPSIGISDTDVGFVDGSFSWGFTPVSELINQPYISYSPKYFSSEVMIREERFEFGDPSKGPISHRYRKFFTQSNDSDPESWAISQAKYRGIFEWRLGADWIQTDETMQAVSDVYKYFTQQRLTIHFQLTQVGFLLTLGDIILLKNIPPHLIPSPMGQGIGDDGRKFQVIELEKDYQNGLVTVSAIDAQDQVLF